MKLNRLKSVVNQVIRESSGNSQGYLVDPFYHIKPEYEIIIDLKNGTITPDSEGDDVDRYYKSIIKWFHEVLPKEGRRFGPGDDGDEAVRPRGDPREKKNNDSNNDSFKRFVHNR